MAWVVPAIAAVGEAAGTAAGAVGSTVASAASALGSLFGAEGAAGAAETAAGVAPEAAAAAGALVPEAATAEAAIAPTVAAPAAATAPGGFIPTVIDAAKAAIPQTGIGTLAQGLQSLFAGSPESAPGFVGPPAALAGPSVVGPGFAGGFVQGLLGQFAPGTAPSGGSLAGGGLGQLVGFLNQMGGGGGSGMPPAQMGPIVHMGGMPQAPFTQLVPNTQQTEIATGPIMKLLAHL